MVSLLPPAGGPVSTTVPLDASGDWFAALTIPASPRFPHDGGGGS
jgi:hypothetical protein